MSEKTRDVERDKLDGDESCLGPKEIGRRTFGRASRAIAGDLAGGAATLLGRARVMVRRRRQAEKAEEGDENDARSTRAKQTVQRPGRRGPAPHEE